MWDPIDKSFLGFQEPDRYHGILTTSPKGNLGLNFALNTPWQCWPECLEDALPFAIFVGIGAFRLRLLNLWRGARSRCLAYPWRRAWLGRRSWCRIALEEVTGLITGQVVKEAMGWREPPFPRGDGVTAASAKIAESVIAVGIGRRRGGH